MPPSRTPRSAPHGVLGISPHAGLDAAITMTPVRGPVIDNSPENPFHQGSPTSSSAAEFRLCTLPSLTSAGGSPARLHLVRYPMSCTSLKGLRAAKVAGLRNGTSALVLLQPQGKFNWDFMISIGPRTYCFSNQSQSPLHITHLLSTDIVAYGLNSSDKQTQFQEPETIEEAENAPATLATVPVRADSNPTSIIVRSNHESPATPGSIIYITVSARELEGEPASAGGLDLLEPEDLGGRGAHIVGETQAVAMEEEQGGNGVRLATPPEFWNGVGLRLEDLEPRHHLALYLDGVPAPTEGGRAHVHYYLDVQVEEIDDDHDTAAESFKRKESSTSRFHDSDNRPMKKNKGYHGNDSNTDSDADDTDNIPDYKGKGKEKAHHDQSRSQKHRYKRRKHENLYHDINLYGHRDSHYED
ncbi:hypothetical protein FA15DRAFT_660839 [Coprinopsis marcescibilis]|uniref:Nucleoplasmin-like domain-containing protein n=1 Tax=Coprinopsis marcescibilis TaxID=230819 RepID=A0A5C3KDU8_COPMA|nr:hypothetical protein FA15DRAFT_660839 [Coprinopsis marcescibilis]